VTLIENFKWHSKSFKLGLKSLRCGPLKVTYQSVCDYELVYPFLLYYGLPALKLLRKLIRGSYSLSSQQDGRLKVNGSVSRRGRQGLLEDVASYFVSPAKE